MRFQDTRIVITGGTRGIGRALALQLRDAGAKVLACGTRHTSVRAFSEQTGIRAVVCDVTESEDVRGLAESVALQLGGVDVLIHCAGVQYEGDVLRGLDLEAVEREIAVNLTGPIRVTQALLDQLLDSPHATIVNMTSILAWAPKQSAPVYCATKAGLASWTQSLRAQLADRHVRVVEVVPPVVATEMTTGRQHGAISPERMGAAVVQGLRRELEDIRVGKARAAGVLHRIAPRILARKLRTA